MKKRFLESIKNPQDLKKMNLNELEDFSIEIRDFLVDQIPKTGGHLASNLGVVELTLAIHKVFNCPKDKIIFDVGHQGYVHKIITGRFKDFGTLRKHEGLSGFLDIEESKYDSFGGSHAGTSLSAAYGFLESQKKKKNKDYVVAMIGDGALTAGMAWEAINNLGGKPYPLIVILNDNEMSISPNVGMVNKFLTKLRIAKNYRKTLRKTSTILSKSKISKGFAKTLSNIKDAIRNFFFKEGALFESFGFRYFGPIDGHNIKQLTDILESSKEIQDRPVLLHVLTKKGKGDFESEKNPVKRHGVAPVAKNTMPSFSKVFADSVIEIAKKDEDVVALTAAMAEGTGLSAFREKIPERFFDVGISEQHAVTASASMALSGLKPICAIYSTFLQRGYDQVVHDVMLQNAHVIFAMDRSGIVGGDGSSAQGFYDLSYLRCLPNMVISAARDSSMIKALLECGLYKNKKPFAIRYPRGPVPDVPKRKGNEASVGKGEILREGKDVAILALGPSAYTAIEAAKKLEKEKISCLVIDPIWIKPLDKDLIKKAAKTKRILTIEEHSEIGGFRSAILESLQEQNLLNETKISSLAIPDIVVKHGGQNIYRKKFGLDEKGICKKVKDLING